MKRFFVDTCVLIWIMQEDSRVDDVYYNMQYYQGDFYISMESITEMVFLIQSGKLKINIPFPTMLKYFEQINLKVLDFDLKALNVLFSLPFFKQHNDPKDRNIIAHAIAENCNLISSDQNFQLYEPYGLSYTEV
jgi:PIN domain nuclease of toxin-antitoxin system